MFISDFWTFILEAENEYSVYKKRIMAEFSLTKAETDIVVFLYNNSEFDTAAKVSKIRKIPKSQVSVSVNSLSDKGFLKCKKCDDNKKSIHLSLTEKGIEVARFGKAVQQEFGDSLFYGFSDSEKKAFETLHMKMLDNIKKGRDK